MPRMEGENMKCLPTKNKELILKTLSAILIVIMLSGCAIPTVIKSKPEGATVYIDNIKMGKTPLTYSDTAILGSQKPIRIEMNGYKPLDTVIRKDQLKPGPLVGAVFAGVPGLWALGYAEEYTFELDRGHATPAKKEFAPSRSTSEDQQNKIQVQSVEKQPEPSIAAKSVNTSSVSMVVIENNAKLRKRPSINATVLKTLKKGGDVQVIKQKDEWCLIETSDGETGWCQRRSLAQR
jgi:hypothetical protein